MKYLDVEEIEKINLFAIEYWKFKKGDSFELKSYSKLVKCLEKCRLTKGDIYDKAVVLMINLVKEHCFASANRRTAFLATKEFLNKNHNIFNVPNKPNNARTFIGIREGYYDEKEIKDWIKKGKIREFKR